MNNQPCLPTGRPIGILDSGVGGLTIWREIIKELPHESTVYIADSVNCPYGQKSEEEIYFLAKRLVQFLVKNKVKLVVVACNTITVACIDRLRQYLLRRHSVIPIPIVGLVPAIKTAGEMTRNKRIGILSTPITAESQYQKRLIDKFARDCAVANIGTDKLVPLIEKGETKGKEIESILRKVLKKFIDKKVDVIALGCSHFPFLKNTIEDVMGSNVKIVDSGEAIARRVKSILTDNNSLLNNNNPSYRFYTTGNVEDFARVSKKLVGDKLGDLIKSVQTISL